MCSLLLPLAFFILCNYFINIMYFFPDRIQSYKIKMTSNWSHFKEKHVIQDILDDFMMNSWYNNFKWFLVKSNLKIITVLWIHHKIVVEVIERHHYGFS